MKTAPRADDSPPRTFWEKTAADLMTPNPVSIRSSATIREAAVLLTDKGFSAAPVMDESGRPVGVLSRADILVHEREKVEYAPALPEYYERTELITRSGETFFGGSHGKIADRARVRDCMTPVVFSVRPDAPASRGIEDMEALKVHRLFVVDTAGVLIGVISALDILRHLRSEPTTSD